MKKIDILAISFGNFRRRKTRSILTVLGVVIGTASIVTMMSLGIAMNVSFNDQLKEIGDLTTITVNAGYDEQTGQQKGGLTDETVAELETIDKVTLVSPQLRLSGKMLQGRYQNYADIIGINAEYMEKLGMKAEQGTLLNPSEHISSGKNIYCLFGAEVPYQFSKPSRGGGGGMFISGGIMIGGDGSEEVREPPPVDVMDQSKKIRFTFDWSYGESNPGMDAQPAKKATLYNIKATGILKKSNGQSDYSVYVDMSTAKKLKKEMTKFNSSDSGISSGGKRSQDTYDTIKVMSNSLEDTLKITEQINQMGYQAYSNAEWITQSQQQSQMLQMILAGIGAVSLLVAAIGITNTMIMSIYERTREIGIMKVIGCYLKDIRTMFLTEAGFIGLFGGIIGILLSYGISLLLNFFSGKGVESGMMAAGAKLSVIPWWLALAAIAFAILIGLISGFLPARRAMRLSALEAMKN